MATPTLPSQNYPLAALGTTTNWLQLVIAAGMLVPGPQYGNVSANGQVYWNVYEYA